MGGISASIWQETKFLRRKVENILSQNVWPANFALMSYVLFHESKHEIQSDKLSKTIYCNQCWYNFVPKHLWFDKMTVSSMCGLACTPSSKYFHQQKSIFVKTKHPIKEIDKKMFHILQTWWRLYVCACVSSDLYPAAPAHNHFNPFSNLDPLFLMHSKNECVLFGFTCYWHPSRCGCK